MKCVSKNANINIFLIERIHGTYKISEDRSNQQQHKILKHENIRQKEAKKNEMQKKK